jgi:hypothetical protein
MNVTFCWSLTACNFGLFVSCQVKDCFPGFVRIPRIWFNFRLDEDSILWVDLQRVIMDKKMWSFSKLEVDTFGSKFQIHVIVDSKSVEVLPKVIGMRSWKIRLDSKCKWVEIINPSTFSLRVTNSNWTKTFHLV